MNSDRTAVILAAGINGLGASRSLARAGVRHAVLYEGSRNPIRWSRLPALKERVPDEWSDDALLSQLRTLRSAYAAVIACSDAFSDFLSRQREALESLGFRVVAPPGTVSETLNDKAAELAAVRDAGVPIPRSLLALPSSVEPLHELLALPVIVKPRSYKYAHLIRTKNVVLRSPEEAVRFCQEQTGHEDAFVAQEIVPGSDESLWVCNATFRAGGVLEQVFIFQRIRTSPPHFGVTTFAVGRDNPVLREYCQMIGRHLSYEGPAMIEFKQSERSKEYFYIETNPRIGMCNYFDTVSGVNNVAAAVGAGQLGASKVLQRDGAMYLNLMGDLESRLSDGESLMSILRSYRSLLSRRVAWAYWNPRDPGPWLAASMGNGYDLFRRALRRARRKLQATGPHAVR